MTQTANPPTVDLEAYLEESAVYIQERITVSREAMLQAGRKLIEVRAACPDGVWGKWLKDNFDWSHSEANKLMQAAENAPHLMTVSEQWLHTGALWMLAANCTPEEARVLALQWVKEKRIVNKQLAYLMSRAHKSILPRFEAGELTERQAYDLGVALADVPDDCQTVRDYAVEQSVSSPWVVSYLTQEYLKWVSFTQDKDREDSAWHDIRHNNCLMIEEESVSLREANQRDVARYINYRVFGHIEKSKSKSEEHEYLIQGESFDVDEDGNLLLSDLTPGARVKVSVYIEEGD